MPKFEVVSEYRPSGDQPKAIEALRAAGWVITGAGHAVASDEATHTGRGFTAVYLET